MPAPATPRPRKALPAIDPDRCTGCGWCVAVCAPHVLSLQVQGEGPWGAKRSQLHDAQACTGCALCAVRCPFQAIRMQRDTKASRTANFKPNHPQAI